MGLLSHIFNPVTQFKDIASAGGRLSNKLKSHMPHWMPTWMKNHAATAINPLAQLAGGDTVGQYYMQREAGQSKAGARQAATGVALRSAALAAIVYGGVVAAGGAGAGGGAAAGSGGAGGAGASAVGDATLLSPGAVGAEAAAADVTSAVAAPAAATGAIDATATVLPEMVITPATTSGLTLAEVGQAAAAVAPVAATAATPGSTSAPNNPPDKLPTQPQGNYLSRTVDYMERHPLLTNTALRAGEGLVKGLLASSQQGGDNEAGYYGYDRFGKGPGLYDPSKWYRSQ